jgi:hypothetical protein
MEVRRRNLSESDYPFTIRAIDATGETVWTRVVEQPGPVYVPPLARTYGPVAIEVEYPDGTVGRTEAPSTA